MRKLPRIHLLRFAFLVLLVAAAAPALKGPVLPGLVRPAGGAIALVGGRVIDGTGAAPRESCTILIEGERIAAIGEQLTIPDGAEIVDVSGRTIVPGLIDMHGHLYTNLAGRYASETMPFARLYLAGGVTTVFSPGDCDPEATLEFRDAQRAGEQVGTRIYSAGPYFNHGVGEVAFMQGVDGPDEARERFRTWTGALDGVKVYMDITPEELSALVEEAHAAGLRVTGHLGSLTAARAIELGIDRLEHGIYAMSEFGRPDPEDTFDIEYLRGLAAIDFESGVGAALIARIVERGIVIDPMVVILESLFAGPIELAPDWRRYLAPQTAGNMARMDEALSSMRAAATDPGEWREVVGAVLDKQRESAAPIPSWSRSEAIRACTLSAAEALGLEQDLGSLSPGKLADLIVLEGDPAADIKALGSTRMVFQAGARFDPSQLRDSVVGKIE